MRLATYQQETEQRVGAVQDSALVDLSSFAPDMLTLIERGPEVLTQAREKVAAVVALVSLTAGKSRTPPATAMVPLDKVRLRAPIPRPRKNIVCLGQNYAAHAIETARVLGRRETVPQHPVFFTKAVTAINHPNKPIPYNANISAELDWEGELAFIIGKKGKNIHTDEAMEYVFGYTILNDVSARDLQARHRQFFKGKSLDGCAPLGPWIVTADEIPDPHALTLRVRLNGDTVQDGNTSAMLFKIPELIAVLSWGMTLEPGDIIATGTPAGVGMAMAPPRFLQPGDTVEVEIEKIGVLKNTVVDAAFQDESEEWDEERTEERIPEAQEKSEKLETQEKQEKQE
jgi:2-keto-4-pentenoate hydratase/2-oxohepta-3-ene-1,7-dioic acid hydratase in catechol pathway